MEFHRRLFAEIMRTAELHESREFYRVGDDMDAPFHPHKDQGERNYTGDPSAFSRAA